MYRKLIALAFALIAFNLLFFPFTKNYLGSFLILLPGTIGFFGITVAFVIFELLAFPGPKGLSAKRWFWLSAATALVASSSALFKTSPVDRLLLGALTLSACGVSFSSLTAGAFSRWIDLALTPFRILANLFSNLMKTGEHLLAVLAPLDLHRPQFFSKKREVLWPILLGLILVIPLAAVLARLLATADPFFADFWGKFVTGLQNIIRIKNFPWWLVSRAVHSVWFMIGALAIAFVSLKEKPRLPQPKIGGGSFAISMAVVVAGVVLLLGSFLVIQFPYLFARVPETELIKYGVRTYSEYVTRGFGELVLVSLIVYSVAIVGLIVSNSGEKRAQILAKLNLVLLGEALIFALSVLRRVYLYQFFHGLTRVRVYGSFFVILLIGLTAILILRHMMRHRSWFMAEIALTALFLLVSGSIGVDRLIAAKFPPTVNGEVDYVYIARLSPDAYAGWQKAYTHAQAVKDELAVKTTYTQEDARKIDYASRIIWALQSQYINLASIYDSKETGIYFRPRPLDIKETNPVEKRVFDSITGDIPFAELANLEKEMGLLRVKVFDQAGPPQLDRSFESPLIK